jgi:DMSO/TMAO reductase YedYZ molybdopterin-dependent catalytic subunit
MNTRLAALLFTAVAAAAPALAQPAKPSESLTIGGAVARPRTLTIADLAKEPVTTEAVFLHTGHGALSGSFTGVLLWTLLEEAGVKLDAGAKNDVVRHTVTVTATDGYAAVLSLGEIAPEFGGDQAIVAYQQDGKPIESGPRLIIPGDKGAGRAISAVASIEVR